MAIIYKCDNCGSENYNSLDIQSNSLSFMHGNAAIESIMTVELCFKCRNDVETNLKKAFWKVIDLYPKLRKV